MRFQFAEAIFRSRINKFSFPNNEMHFKSLIQKNSMSDNRRLDPVGQCKVPCQLEPFWIPFARVLELSDIPRSMHFLIRSKSGDMIDVGKCAGNCNPFFKPLYENLVRPQISLRLPLCDIKDMQTVCVPIEYDDIETEIIGDENMTNGPTIKNLVIRSCACTEVETCY